MCRDLHVCRYYLKGSCRYGNKCRLSHVVKSNQEKRGRGRKTQRHRERSRSSSN
ncbi:uncharacterized protein LOC109915785 isoform X1, partial [Tachysurus ichikawai]